MPGLGLFVSEDLDALVARYVEALAPTDDPLARPTVVVANSAVGQWFEQAVARRTGRPGVDDGVVAYVDTIFPSGLLGDSSTAITGPWSDGRPRCWRWSWARARGPA